MAPEKKKSAKQGARSAARKSTRSAGDGKTSAKRAPLKSVRELEPSRARSWWLGLQVPDELDTQHYVTAFAACMFLADTLEDNRAIELQIDVALDKGLKSTKTVQRMQEALAVYFVAQYDDKPNQLRRALDIELSDGSNPLMPIGVWAYLQRDYVASGKLSSKEAKVLEDTLVLACLPKDGNVSKVSNAVRLLRTGDLDGAVAQATKSGGGCALPIGAIVAVAILLGAL